MPFDFDTVVDRRNTYSLKHDTAAYGKSDDILPLWVADMDFQSPPCVLEALAEQVKHGVFGYSDMGEPYFAALHGWFSRRFGWDVDRDWLIKTPGVVNAIHVALLALTEPGDGVVVQQPVYYPFASAVRKTGGRLVVNALIHGDDGYQIDFDDFEKKIVANDVKAFILCNPHNPVGRVWTREELTRLGDVCLRRGVIVISDEIHQDFVSDGHRHIPFAGLAPKYRDIAVVCTAPTKTFNLAGLPVANIFIPDTTMRERFLRAYGRLGIEQLGVMGVVACRAAYEHGERWLGALLDYLAGNMALIGNFLGEKLPDIKLVRPEGTYLAWLDFRLLGLGEQELDDLIANKAGLWLQNGTVFGAGGSGFMRLNAACPRSILREALARLERAVRG